MDNTNSLGFNETEWMKMLFLIVDTQAWMDEIEKGIICMVPIENKKKLFKKSYRLTASALAHILERHYYKIPRHPEASKFTIPVHEILYCIREAGSIIPTAISGCWDFERIIDATGPVGFNINGEITDIFPLLVRACY